MNKKKNIGDLVTHHLPWISLENRVGMVIRKGKDFDHVVDFGGVFYALYDREVILCDGYR
jgi:hypothetical protein